MRTPEIRSSKKVKRLTWLAGIDEVRNREDGEWNYLLRWWSNCRIAWSCSRPCAPLLCLGAVFAQVCRNFCFGVAAVDDSVSGAVPSRNPNVYLDEFHQSTRSLTETSLCKAYSDCCETSEDALETMSTTAGFAIFVEKVRRFDFSYSTFHLSVSRWCYEAMLCARIEIDLNLTSASHMRLLATAGSWGWKKCPPRSQRGGEQLRKGISASELFCEQYRRLSAQLMAEPGSLFLEAFSGAGCCDISGHCCDIEAACAGDYSNQGIETVRTPSARTLSDSEVQFIVVCSKSFGNLRKPSK